MCLYSKIELYMTTNLVAVVAEDNPRGLFEGIPFP